MLRLTNEAGEDLMLAGNVPAQYFLPVGTIINHADGSVVNVGDVLARIPRKLLKLAISRVVYRV